MTILRQYSLLIATIAYLFFLTGCNSSDSSTDSSADISFSTEQDDSGSDDVTAGDDVTYRLSGPWRLQSTATAYDFIVDDSGRFIAFDGNGLFSGGSADSIYLTDDGVIAGGAVCVISINECDNFSMDLDVNSENRLSGTIVSGGDTLEVSLQRTSTLDSKVSMSDIANKTWVNESEATNTMMIYSDGSLDGTDSSGNAFSGNMKESGNNAFSFSANLQIEGVAITINGLAYMNSSDQIVYGGHQRVGDIFYITSGVLTEN